MELGRGEGALWFEAVGKAKTKERFVVFWRWGVGAEVVAGGGNWSVEEGVAGGVGKGNGNIMPEAVFVVRDKTILLYEFCPGFVLEVGGGRYFLLFCFPLFLLLEFGLPFLVSLLAPPAFWFLPLDFLFGLSGGVFWGVFVPRPPLGAALFFS